jgi:glycosyltransferase involved in cell wall biosynthesis
MKHLNENLKIFFVNKFKWLDSAPMATVSTFSTHAMAELGFDTTLIIQGDPSVDTNSILKNKFGLVPLKNYKVKLFTRNKTRWLKTSSIFYWKAVHYILSQRGIHHRTIVITRNTSFLIYLVILRKFFKITTLFETHGYHGYETLKGIPPTPHRPFLKLSHQYQILEKLFINRISGLVCITGPQMKLYLKDFVRIPALLLPLGSPEVSDSPDFSAFQSNAYDQKNLCYIGRLNQHINYKMVFKTLNLLEDQSIKFIWLGLKPENILILESEIKKQRLEDRVVLIGWLNHRDMNQYLKKHISIGLVAYKPTYQSMVITSPSKIFDYFAVGLPVIAPDIPTVEDIVIPNRNGLLYIPDNAESLANCINELFKSRKKYLQFQKTSIESAQEFSWKNRAKKLMSFIESLS